MNNRHPYADILIAIAEGKTVQFLVDKWLDFDYNKHSYPGKNSMITEWRVKPEIAACEIWINIYPDKGSSTSQMNIYSSKYDADRFAHKSRIACVKLLNVEYYEGQGLDKNSS